MPKKAHTEEQIVAVLQQGQAGEKVADICRRVGISEGTYYAWKKHYAGLGISELRELRQLREENGRLKRLVWANFWGAGQTPISSWESIRPR